MFRKYKNLFLKIAFLFIFLGTESAWTQHLGSTRGISIGAYTSLANELGSLDWNPAGLTRVRDWEFSTSSALSSKNGSLSKRMSFQSFGGTKKIFETHSLSVRYSPGFNLDFVVPSTFQLPISGQSITFDKKISYREPYALGYGFQVSPTMSLGVSARFREESMNDTQPFFGKDTIARIRFVEYDASFWSFDIGLQWNSGSRWQFGIIAKNLFMMRESEFPQEARPFALRPEKSIRFGLGYRVLESLTAAIDFDSRQFGASGIEWNFTPVLQIRNGFYFQKGESPFITGISASVGWTFESARLDAGYFHRTGGTNGRKPTLQDFIATGIRDIAFNQYTTSQFIVTVSVPLGNKREALAKIEWVDISSEVYPSSHYIYAYRPIGTARVRNISSKPIEARLSFFVENYMDSPTETNPYVISPDGVFDIPITAIFNDAVTLLPAMVLKAADVFVKASPHAGYDDKVQTRVVFRGRNEWDGNVLTLRHFVTPDEPEIMKFSRRVVTEYKEELTSGPTETEKLKSAIKLFEEFSLRMTYVRDPKLSKDRVQFPSETLLLRGGDCDDLAVSFSSILSSVGISTAFIDVIPPGKEDEAHIYMMFDTGVPASQANLVSENAKRYIIRRDFKGKETVWIPLETTSMTEGFEKAWDLGAQAYYSDIVEGMGLLQGWVRIVDVMPR